MPSPDEIKEMQRRTRASAEWKRDIELSLENLSEAYNDEVRFQITSVKGKVSIVAETQNPQYRMELDDLGIGKWE